MVDTSKVLAKLKKSVASASKTKLKMRKIIKKGRRATIVIQAQQQQPTQIVPSFRQIVADERRQLFFT